MNTNFYAIEIASAEHDQRFLNQVKEAQLADDVRAGRSTLMSSILRLFAHAF